MKTQQTKNKAIKEKYNEKERNDGTCMKKWKNVNIYWKQLLLDLNAKLHWETESNWT